MRYNSKYMYSLDDGMSVPQEWIVSEAKYKIVHELVDKLPFKVDKDDSGIVAVELDIDVYDAKEFRKKLFELLNQE